KLYRERGLRGSVGFYADFSKSARVWFPETFASPAVADVCVPYLSAPGIGPEEVGSAYVARRFGVGTESGPTMLPKGGGSRLIDALVRLIEDQGGRVEANAEVVRIGVADGRASSVTLADGSSQTARRAVLANVTPQALYRKLLDGDAPEDYARR